MDSAMDSAEIQKGHFSKAQLHRRLWPLYLWFPGALYAIGMLIPTQNLGNSVYYSRVSVRV
jgi:hypothetical protein